MDSRIVENREYLERQIRERYEESGLGDPDGLEKIGSGFNRTVYKVVDDTYGQEAEGMVVKVQHPDSHENRMECEVWRRYKGTKFEKYLVPIKDNSSSYEWILMPFGDSVPEDLVDTELKNLLEDVGGSDISDDDFVYMDGNFANQRCCDYATISGFN